MNMKKLSYKLIFHRTGCAFSISALQMRKKYKAFGINVCLNITTDNIMFICCLYASRCMHEVTPVKMIQRVMTEAIDLGSRKAHATIGPCQTRYYRGFVKCRSYEFKRIEMEVVTNFVIVNNRAF